MAWITVAGPEMQSPPAKTPGMSLTSAVLHASISPRLTGIPSFSKSLVSMPWPIAMTIMSAGILTGFSLASEVIGLPSETLPTICGWTKRAVTFPSSSVSILFGLASSYMEQPSATASSISSFMAGMSAFLLLYIILDLSAPSLTADLATSIATFPPPRTRTLLPSKSG